MSGRLAYLAGKRRDARQAYAAARHHHARSAALGQQLSRATTALLREEVRAGGKPKIAAKPDAAGKPLKVPGVFVLSVAPFFMGEAVRLPVRLRYRADGGKLAWYIVPYRPDLHVTERVRDDLDMVAHGTSLPTFEGSPEA